MFVQKLSNELDETQSVMDSIDGSVESGVPGLTDTDARDIKEHVSHLGSRWRDLRQKLHYSLEEHTHLISRQQQFEKRYSHISVVLDSVLRLETQENMDALEVCCLLVWLLSFLLRSSALVLITGRFLLTCSFLCELESCSHGRVWTGPVLRQKGLLKDILDRTLKRLSFVLNNERLFSSFDDYFDFILISGIGTRFYFHLLCIALLTLRCELIGSFSSWK